MERPLNVVNTEEIAEQDWGEGRCHIRRRDLGRAVGSVDVGLKRIVILAGYQSYPEHAHTSEEELFYILRGRGTALQDGEHVPVEAGDVISYPSGTGIAHTFVADRDEDLEYLAFGERDGGDTTFYPRSGKILIRALREQATGPSKALGLVGRMEEADYWEGER